VALFMGMCQARTMTRARKKLPLHEWYVISIRPLNQHGGVRRSASKFGATTFAISTLRQQPLDAGPALRQALACSRVLVTSPAAARLAAAQTALRKRSGQQWFALGLGTATALRRHGVSEVLLPARGSDSESLLALEQLQAVRGSRIGLITAPGGRGLLASELQARGAMVITANVYRRQPLPLSAKRLHALAALPPSTALLVTSGEAFDLLWQGLDARARRHLLHRPCVTVSARLTAKLRVLGFTTVLRSSDTRPAKLLATLASHVGDGRFR
jgi:uroporphyrinogen-III synthase